MRLRPNDGEELLRSCYTNVLAEAAFHGIREVAFPSISTGIYQYPFDAATRVAMQTARDLVRLHPDRFNRIVFIYFDQRSLERASAIANEFRDC
jgi:O-acetyl-ADP-ribose deacetylase (regulator of RNase III)